MKQNSTLRCFRIYGDNFSDETGVALAEALKHNFALRSCEEGKLAFWLRAGSSPLAATSDPRRMKLYKAQKTTQRSIPFDELNIKCQSLRIHASHSRYLKKEQKDQQLK